MRLDSAVNIADLRRLAKRRLPKLVFDYIDGGVEDEIGLAENINAFARHKLVPRFLTDCSKIDLRTELFGKIYSLPFGIGPTGVAGLFHPKGDLLLAEAALTEGVPYTMSGTSSAAIEDLPASAAKNAWYQLYTGHDKKLDEEIVRRAQDAGMQTLVLTVDSEVRTRRERDIRNGFGLPRLKPLMLLESFRHAGWILNYRRNGGRPLFGTFARYADRPTHAQTVMNFMTSHLPGNPTWKDVERYRRLWPGKFLVKGLLHPDDAKCAFELGADGVVVSNHGGRQLDRAPAAIDMLPAIRNAVGPDRILIVDGGVRRGSDIITALSLGADFVFVGRATLYGLAAGGLAGVHKAISILRLELETVGRQMGCGSVKDFGPQRLFISGEIHRTPASYPHGGA
ncbi:MAG TPA: alpha-hydroxy acid oxidase [Alphaproteobacteria bacterium]|nr:alpha-hydroxy acid oxidase [Alphaproteobacteria bacterium]